jgi:cytochrome P450
MYYRAKGKPVKWIHAQHNRYGPVVRIAPNELSFIGPDAWDDIYGHRTPNKVNRIKFAKDPRVLGPDFFVKPGNPTGLTRASDSAHAPQRRIVASAFSDKALKNQEPLLRSYVDLLIRKLRNIEESVNEQDDPIVDLVGWYNFTTFDIMADLTFGEPLYMLNQGKYTQWVQALFSSIKIITFNQVSNVEKFSPQLIHLSQPSRFAVMELS